MYFTSTDGSEDTFVYQPTVDTLELKKDKGTDYVLSWKSNGVYNSKHKSLYTASYIGIKFDKHPLAVEQNNLIIFQKSFNNLPKLQMFTLSMI